MASIDGAVHPRLIPMAEFKVVCPYEEKVRRLFFETFTAVGPGGNETEATVQSVFESVVKHITDQPSSIGGTLFWRKYPRCTPKVEWHHVATRLVYFPANTYQIISFEDGDE